MNCLDLSQNSIATLEENTIKGHFVQLSLEDNILESFSFQQNSFGNLTNLKEISFVKNLIRKLNFGHAFQFDLLKLEKLSFKFRREVISFGLFI